MPEDGCPECLSDLSNAELASLDLEAIDARYCVDEGGCKSPGRRINDDLMSLYGCLNGRSGAKGIGVREVPVRSDIQVDRGCSHSVDDPHRTVVDHPFRDSVIE